LYRDADQAATNTPGQLPEGLKAFARDGLQRLLADPMALGCALGEVMTEPKPKVWFEEPGEPWVPAPVVLDRRTRMMYDAHHVFINGEAYRAAGRDATLMRALSDQRTLPASAVRRASAGAQALLADWYAAGWLHTPKGAA
jgi:50S ribosomal protein L16 3-hydroxylase